MKSTNNEVPPTAAGGNPDDHDSIADDRFIHGLLEFTHRDSPATRNDRVGKVMKQIRSGSRTSRPPHRQLFTRVVPLATAAAITLVAFSIFILAPQPAAYAMVNAAIEATRSASELRYEIQILDQDHNDQLMKLGTLDMRGELLRVQVETPNENAFVMGRDHEGDWSLRRDGSVERINPRGAAPRWINLGESTILVGSLDEMLLQLRNDYAVEEVASTDAQSGKELTPQIIATRLAGINKPGPEQVKIWITADTSIVDRLELHWNQPSAANRQPNRPEQKDGPPGPSGDRRPPNPQHPPMREATSSHMHPQLLLNPPQFGSGHHPPPPQRIVFQRVEPIHLADSEFSPPIP